MPQAQSAGEYLTAYSVAVNEAVCKIDKEKIQQVYLLLKKTTIAGGRIYVAGNGGSSAISDHLCCDFMKGTQVLGHPTLRVHSLTANHALFTALANDFQYEEALSRQVEMLCDPQDILILISSSGNSPNIIRALEVAQAKKIKVVGFCGFSGGQLAQRADFVVHVPIENYGMVEDAHQMIMHVLAQTLMRERQEASKT